MEYQSMDGKPACPRCNSDAVIRSGKVQGRQRHRCKACGFQFTGAALRGRPAAEKALAVTLYTMGLPMSAIAGLFQVSTPAVLRWVRTFSEREHEKPQPAEVVFVEPDEMRRLLKSKKTNVDSGKPVVVISLNSLTGNVEGAIRLASPRAFSD